MLLLDCCYGGAFGAGVAVRAAGDVHVLDSFPTGRLGGGRGRAVISASNAMEYAFEGERLRDDALPEPSLFTAALVRGLATGEADRDEDGWVSLNELYDYVFDRVRGGQPEPDADPGHRDAGRALPRAQHAAAGSSPRRCRATCRRRWTTPTPTPGSVPWRSCGRGC